MKYIHIYKDDVPYQFEMKLNSEFYNFEINYNSEGDFFTVDMWKDDDILAIGEKLTNYNGLFETYRDERFPEPVLVPADVSDESKRAGFKEINEHVKLYVLED